MKSLFIVLLCFLFVLACFVPSILSNNYCFDFSYMFSNMTNLFNFGENYLQQILGDAQAEQKTLTSLLNPTTYTEGNSSYKGYYHYTCSVVDGEIFFSRKFEKFGTWDWILVPVTCVQMFLKFLSVPLFVVYGFGYSLIKLFTPSTWFIKLV